MLSSLNNFHGEELASDAFIETISLELDVVIEKAKTNNHLPTPPPPPSEYDCEQQEHY